MLFVEEFLPAEEVGDNPAPGADGIVGIGIARAFLSRTLAEVTFDLFIPALGFGILNDAGKKLIRLIHRRGVRSVIAAEQVPEARKLLKLTLSLGGDNTRTVFAGIKAAYEPEKLVGRLVVMVANLAPRQMKFGLSEGMVVAVGGGGEEVFLLGVDEGGKPGMRVH